MESILDMNLRSYCEISSFRHGTVETLAVLKCCAV